MMTDLIQAAGNLKEVFGLDLDPRVGEAAAKFPRDRFVSRIYDDRRKEWVTNNDANRWRELLSEDRFIPIQTNEAGETTSSISQPSLVFAMIQSLHLQPGDRVLEIGAASGWSAALMADLIGPEGEVVSVEIDRELVDIGTRNIADNKLGNVRVLAGDALAAVSHEAPFDKIIYTVGARDFPASLLDATLEGGRVVLVHKVDSTADILYAGEKENDRLNLLPVAPVLFVELRGELESNDEFTELKNLPESWRNLPFWGDVSGYVDLLYRTAGLRFFLRMTSPHYHLVRYCDLTGFGLCGPDGTAVVLKGTNAVKGDHRGLKMFHRLLSDWVDLGLPGLTAFKLALCRPGSEADKTYQFRGKELVYDYLPLRPAPERMTDYLQLRAASG